MTNIHFHVDSGACVDLNIGGEIYGVETPPYEGAYEATPSWDVQTFKTAKLTMKQDFTVYDITKLEVANDSGGLTLTI